MRACLNGHNAYTPAIEKHGLLRQVDRRTDVHRAQEKDVIARHLRAVRGYAHRQVFLGRTERLEFGPSEYGHARVTHLSYIDVA